MIRGLAATGLVIGVAVWQGPNLVEVSPSPEVSGVGAEDFASGNLQSLSPEKRVELVNAVATVIRNDFGGSLCSAQEVNVQNGTAIIPTDYYPDPNAGTNFYGEGQEQPPYSKIYDYEEAAPRYGGEPLTDTVTVGSTPVLVCADGDTMTIGKAGIHVQMGTNPPIVQATAEGNANLFNFYSDPARLGDCVSARDELRAQLQGIISEAIDVDPDKVSLAFPLYMHVGLNYDHPCDDTPEAP